MKAVMGFSSINALDYLPSFYSDWRHQNYIFYFRKWVLMYDLSSNVYLLKELLALYIQSINMVSFLFTQSCLTVLNTDNPLNEQFGMHSSARTRLLDLHYYLVKTLFALRMLLCNVSEVFYEHNCNYFIMLVKFFDWGDTVYRQLLLFSQQNPPVSGAVCLSLFETSVLNLGNLLPQGFKCKFPWPSESARFGFCVFEL